MNIISANGLYKCYNDGLENKIEVLKGVDFTLHQKQKVAIVGASGSGKSTLLHVLGLLVEPNSGKISLKNEDTTTMKEKSKSKIRNSFFGYVVQEFALVEEDTVYCNVEIPTLYSSQFKNAKEKKDAIISAIDKVGLKDKLHTKAKHLSGGQRQRVAIARAIVNNPSVILADEPTGSLDVSTSNEIFKLFSVLVDEGHSLILVTHNPELAKRCDIVYKMENGNLTDITCNEQNI